MTVHPPIPTDFRPQLIALDIDGTLVAHDGSVSERVTRSIGRVQEAGVSVALATGRSLSTTVPVARAAGLTDAVVCSNGALLVSVASEEVLEASTFDPRPALEELIIHLPDAVFAVEDVKGVFHATREFPAGPLGMSIREVPFEHLLAEPVIRLVVRSDQHVDIGFGELIRELGYESVVYGVAEVAWLDITADGVNKASMLDRLCTLRGLDPRRTLAIGDFWNDIEMLQWAGWGVALHTAPHAVRAVSRSVVENDPGEAVADVLDSLAL